MPNDHSQPGPAPAVEAGDRVQLVCGGRVMGVEWVNRRMDKPFGPDALEVVIEKEQTPSTVE